MPTYVHGRDSAQSKTDELVFGGLDLDEGRAEMFGEIVFARRADEVLVLGGVVVQVEEMVSPEVAVRLVRETVPLTERLATPRSCRYRPAGESGLIAPAGEM